MPGIVSARISAWNINSALPIVSIEKSATKPGKKSSWHEWKYWFHGIGLKLSLNLIIPSQVTVGELNPEMHQTKKGNMWHFGMKTHIGVDARTGLTHSFETTANEHIQNLAEQLLHGEEQYVFADAGYRGIDKR